MSTLPDYYAFLNVSPNATTDEIRQAYKKESLKCVINSSCLFERIGNELVLTGVVIQDTSRPVREGYSG